MSSLLKSLVASAPARRIDVDIPGTFVEFCRQRGVELTPGQEELCRVAYDGEAPRDAALATTLFGSVPSAGYRRVVCAVCGRRAGKSYVLVALRLVYGMLTRKLPKLPPGNRAVALIIAPRDTMRLEVYRYALGAVQADPGLARMLVSVKVDSFMMRRPDGALVSFETGVATAGGTAARGRWFTDYALDESAFFRDDSFKVNDEELFRAGSATLLPGGQVLVTSTPWAETGLLYRLWKERPEGTIVAHAPTLVLNDSEVTRDAVKQAEAQDPDNAAREFGAKFMTTGTTVFFESSTIDASLSDELFALQPHDVVVAGGDFGFLADSSACILIALRDDILHVFDGTEERPSEGAPLKPSVTVATFAALIAGRCVYLMADQHYREAIAEHLEAFGLLYAPAPTKPPDAYVRTRMLFREGKVVIHKPNLEPELVARLIQQMREVQGRPTSGGGMSIVHPRWAKGGHGDLVAALVLAAWQVSGDTVPLPTPTMGTQEWVAEQKERRRERLAEQQERPAWMARGPAADRGGWKDWRRR